MRTKSITFIALLVITGTQLLFAQKSEKRTLPAFSEISLGMSATVHLSQGNDQSVELKGKEDVLEKIITEVKDRKLIIRNPANSGFINMWKTSTVDIYITIPQIDGLTLGGSGSILADDKIDTKTLDLSLSGSGNIRLGNLRAEKVSSHLSGSGSVFLAGQRTASEFNTVISGSGSVKAVGLEANDVSISIGGSGNCWVTANKNLVVRIGGSGNVYYHGNPAVDSSIGGSGRVKAEH